MAMLLYKPTSSTYTKPTELFVHSNLAIIQISWKNPVNPHFSGWNMVKSAFSDGFYPPPGPHGATGRYRRLSSKEPSRFSGTPPDAPTASWTPCDRAAARRRPRGGDGNGEVQQKRATKTGLGLVRCGETMKQKKHEQLGILGKLYIYISIWKSGMIFFFLFNVAWIRYRYGGSIKKRLVALGIW